MSFRLQAYQEETIPKKYIFIKQNNKYDAIDIVLLETYMI